MLMSVIWVLQAVVLVFLCLPVFPAMAQTPPDSLRVSILYTGKSLGALGVRRAQDEHDLLTEQANADGIPFRLVSHMAWRTPGIVIFMPGQEPEGDELPLILSMLDEAERIDSVRALISANVLLLSDPWRPEDDLLAMLERNPRRQRDFPDLIEIRVNVSRIRTPQGQRVVIVEQPGAVWPAGPDTWTVGEVNRVDVLESRLFELPMNLGELGPRATVLRSMRDNGRTDFIITADLGHQDGDLGLAREDRARLDLAALTRLDYGILVPFEFELALGAAELVALKDEFPTIDLLAANVKAGDSTLLTVRRVIEAGPVRLGVIGLVNPVVRDRLPRAALDDFRFEHPLSAARREVERLRVEGVDAIVVLSNLSAADNAQLAQEVTGIDAIVADVPIRWAPEAQRIRVDLPDRPFVRPGAPALIARSAANGIGAGRLDLEFRRRGDGNGLFLAALEHSLETVTDRTPPDTALVKEIGSLAVVVRRPRGELMFPAFVDLADRHPELRNFDEVTALGRVSQGMWEAFMARLLRLRGRTEVAIIRRLEHFPPLIGKLHENEIGAWLWTEDEIVIVDVLGSDLRAILREDVRGDLATSGIDPARGTVQGHRINDRAYYRVATTDVLYEGARFRQFERGRRVRRVFGISPMGDLVATPDGTPIALKDFVFDELRRIRSGARGRAHMDEIAALVAPDPPYTNLLMLVFEQPTIWVSLNNVRGNEGYGGVPESRINAQDAWVAGVSGRFVVTHEGHGTAADLGLGFAYARQSIRIASGGRDVIESADDLKLDLTFRPSTRSAGSRSVHPFIRGLFDTEFTPTVDPTTGISNPRQLAVRASLGLLKPAGPVWRRGELAVAVENDLSQHNLQFGFQARADIMRPVGRAAHGGGPVYRLRNDLTYFLPSGRDTERSLALRYNMIHEFLVPLLDELALSVALDFFFFQGKVDATRQPGMSTLLRVGLTYDRLWKPRYQPLF